MKILPKNDLDLVSLSQALKHGDVLLYPTETVAGIGCIGSNRDSVEKVFAAKQRDMDKPVSYAFSSLHMVQKYVKIPDTVKPLLSLFPGPITLIIPRLEGSPVLYGTDNRTLGVRIPDIPWLLKLIELTGEPIITTSANISGLPAPVSVSELKKHPSIEDNTDFLIQWEGQLNGIPSTVIDCINEPKIIRSGAIEEAVINQLLGT